MNINALGMVEVSGTTAAIDALDLMCKAADVTLLTWEKRLGGRLVTVVVTGSVSDAQAAVDAVMRSCISKPVAHAVIASPHAETKRIIEMSAANHNIDLDD